MNSYGWNQESYRRSLGKISEEKSPTNQKVNNFPH